MNALFFGLSTLDIQYLIPHHPAPNSKTKTETAHIEIGGPATNAAITFAHLAGRAQLATVLGQHPLTDYFNQQFQNFHVQHTDLASAHTVLPTFASVFTNKKNGDRSIITNKSALPDISSTLVSNLLKPEIKIVLIDGFYMQAAIQLAREAQKREISVVLDGGSWKTDMDKLLPHIDIAICSADFRLPDGYPELGKYFRSVGIQQFAITHGEQAVIFESRSAGGSLPVKSVNVIDTLGAGDVFHGAFCYYYLKNGIFIKSLERAIEIASKSCQYLGAKKWIEEESKKMTLQTKTLHGFWKFNLLLFFLYKHYDLRILYQNTHFTSLNILPDNSSLPTRYFR